MIARTKNAPAPTATIRCAIYCRKSTEEGLQQEFNSLDCQRESAEAYIQSLKHEGWECLPDEYSDGGFSGGNMDRPALKRLMADIEAGKIDAVAVYKVDRLSRSLLDFARILEVFERHHVAFISITQQINSHSSMGRLMLNVLLSFAQFEREIISERTRDKIAAARRKGKWSGGMPVIGYNVDANTKLVVDKDEAVRVRKIFELYLQHQSLIATVQELDKRGWVNKRWMTRKNGERGGKPFTKTNLHKLLTNVTYIGKVRYKSEVHAGEHEAIVSVEVWQRVQTLLSRNGRTGGAAVRNKFGALLKGILRCVNCDCAMSPTHSTKNQKTRYRYYACTGAQKRGWNTCPSKSIPAGEIEQFVIEQIRCVGRDPTLLQETLAQARKQCESEIAVLDAENGTLNRDLVRWNNELRKLVQQMRPGNGKTDQLADLHERICGAEQRMTLVHEQIAALGSSILTETDVAKAMADFDPVWESLTPAEQVRIVQLLVERVDYNGATGDISITFHPSGIKTLANELNRVDAEEAA